MGIMIAAQKSKSLVFGIPGLLLQIGCITLNHVLFPNTGDNGEAPTDLTYMSLAAGSLIGVILLIVGLRHYARAKGYSPNYGFLGLLSLLGVLIIVLLPDKTKDQTSKPTSPEVT